VPSGRENAIVVEPCEVVGSVSIAQPPADAIAHLETLLNVQNLEGERRAVAAIRGPYLMGAFARIAAKRRLREGRLPKRPTAQEKVSSRCFVYNLD
jgi:hypothetical protein